MRKEMEEENPITAIASCAPGFVPATFSTSIDIPTGDPAADGRISLA